MTKTWNKENNQLLLLLIISFLSVYFLPMIANNIVFIILMLIAINSKNDYFWLTWFFILNDAPGRLFNSGTADSQRLPLITISSGISIGFQEIFLAMYLIKMLSSPIHLSFVFRKYFNWFFIFAIVMLLYSAMLGMDFNVLIITVRNVSPWLWVLVFAFFIKNEETMVKVSRLLFPLVILALVSQIYTYFTGMYFDSYFSKTGGSIVKNDLEEATALRSGSMGFIMLFSLIQSFYYLFNNKTYFKRNYLVSVIVVITLSVILSATRGWIIALIAIFIFISMFMSTKAVAMNIIRALVLFTILFGLMQLLFPVVITQFDSAIDRLATVQLIAEGDLTAGGTLSRISDRSPAVMKLFWERPILGWGFTAEYFKAADGHVGNQTLLLNVGIIGYGILMSIFFGIFFKIWHWSKIKSQMNGNYEAIRVYAIGMLGVFIIHSSSVELWGFHTTGSPTLKPLFFAALFTAANCAIFSKQRDRHSLTQ
jgi:hypothetical protein